MPDLHELATAADAMAAQLAQVREQQAAVVVAVRRRTRMLAALIAVVLVVGVGVSTAGFLFTRSVHCAFYRDLQPAAAADQPVGEYGRRVLADARSASERLHC